MKVYQMVTIVSNGINTRKYYKQSGGHKGWWGVMRKNNNNTKENGNYEWGY